MCGLLVTNKNVSTKEADNEFLCQRGPDKFQYNSINDITFIHTLLSITGEVTPQPLTSEDVVFLYNGEIYNYNLEKNYDSDGYFVIDSYLNEGDSFIHKLDGEFALVIVDFRKSKIIFSTDVFGTKPLYKSIEKDKFGFSSYMQSLKNAGFKNIEKCKPNTFITLDLESLNVIQEKKVKTFNLEQSKDNFDDWNEAFLNSIKKRFSNLNYDILLPLSSGHDSGIIACSFEILDIKFDSFSFIGNEDKNILMDRLKRKRDNWNDEVLTIEKEALDEQERDQVVKYLKNNCEEFFYGSNINNQNNQISGFDDPGAHGLTFILGQVKERNNNFRILASGQGGDEIYSNMQNYHFGNPNPKKFPKKLSKVFPWENFYYGAQSSYLGKEENIGGSYGIETRYPLLDFYVVQEYISLSRKLKNKHYKSPISNFLKLHNYPYLTGNPLNIKKGFNV